MKSLVFDTDILSTFGKIQKLDLLRKLIPDVPFLIPPSVYDELLRAKDHGYDFVDYVFESDIFEVTSLCNEELLILKELKEEKASLGKGELEGLSICKYKSFILITNDTSAKNACDFYGIEFIDLSMILKSLLEENILTYNDVRTLIDEIENKDKVIIKDKEDILSK